VLLTLVWELYCMKKWRWKNGGYNIHFAKWIVILFNQWSCSFHKKRNVGCVGGLSRPWSRPILFLGAPCRGLVDSRFATNPCCHHINDCDDWFVIFGSK
jgi:hypothetical protein